jgi:hypothetical protein
VPAPQRPDYHKWTRFYLDFCHKHGHPPRSPTSLGPFLSKLAAKNQSVEQRHQAAQAIRLLLGGPAEPSANLPVQTAKGPVSTAPTPGGQSQPVVPTSDATTATDTAGPSRAAPSPGQHQPGRKPRLSPRHGTGACTPVSPSKLAWLRVSKAGPLWRSLLGSGAWRPASLACQYH